MVLGDTVNTASRLQSIAEPGTVLVDDATRRASEAAIAYEDAGSARGQRPRAAVRAWTALRVVAGAGGARRSAGLEAPFVGRERELQAIIEAGEESARKARSAGRGGGRGRLRQVTAAVGVLQVPRWHRGRPLVAPGPVSVLRRGGGLLGAGGDGPRAGPDRRGGEPSSAREKLRAVVEEFVRDERERRLVEPRLAHLLRLEERPRRRPRGPVLRLAAVLRAAWPDDSPVILAFEDLQWADSGLLDFIDYLLEWSADMPIFVLALGAPGARGAAAGLGSRWRSAAAPPTIAELLEGWRRGCPTSCGADRPARRRGFRCTRWRPSACCRTAACSSRTAPRYLRRRGRSPTSRCPRRCRRWWPPGWTASRRGAVAVAGRLGARPIVHRRRRAGGAQRRGAGRQRVLDGLVAKQVLGRDDDPRSPERGQYVFLQALLRTVAYGTLSRRARKAKHVAAARPPRADVAGRGAGHRRGAGLALPGGDPGRPRRRGCGRPPRFGRERLDAGTGSGLVGPRP